MRCLGRDTLVTWAVRCTVGVLTHCLRARLSLTIHHIHHTVLHALTALAGRAHTVHHMTIGPGITSMTVQARAGGALERARGHCATDHRHEGNYPSDSKHHHYLCRRLHIMHLR